MPTSATPSQGGSTIGQTQADQFRAKFNNYRRWFILATVIIGTFMAVLDITIVNVAIPSITKGLRASLSEVEFVVASYTLVYAVLVITGGRLGDHFGYKRLFILGITCFTTASALGGMAPTVQLLIAARVFQGFGAALAYPQVLSTIQVTFIGPERTFALGVYGATIGLASIAGQLLGGSLIQANLGGLTWRPIFLVNVPVGVTAIVAANFLLVNRQSTSRPRLDLGGIGLVTIALLLLIVPLISGQGTDWPIWMLLSLIASIPFFVTFFWFEQRVARQGGFPLVNPALFRQRAFTVGVIIALTLFTGTSGFLLILTLFLQLGLGFSPLQAGLTYAPYAIGFFLTSLFAPRLIPLLGRGVLSVGYFLMALSTIALLIILLLEKTAISSWAIFLCLLIRGFGAGFGLTPAIGTIVSRVQSRDAGAAAGIISTSFQVGSVLGVALVGFVFFFIKGLQPVTSTRVMQYSAAFDWTLPLIVILALVAYGLVFLLPRSKNE